MKLSVTATLTSSSFLFSHFLPFFHFLPTDSDLFSSSFPASSPSPEPQRLASLGSLLDDQHWHHVALEQKHSHLNLSVDKHVERIHIPLLSNWSIRQVGRHKHDENADSFMKKSNSHCVFISWVSGPHRGQTSSRRTSRAAWKTCFMTTSTWSSCPNAETHKLPCRWGSCSHKWNMSFCLAYFILLWAFALLKD